MSYQDLLNLYNLLTIELATAQQHGLADNIHADLQARLLASQPWTDPDEVEKHSMLYLRLCFQVKSRGRSLGYIKKELHDHVALVGPAAVAAVAALSAPLAPATTSAHTAPAVASTADDPLDDNDIGLAALQLDDEGGEDDKKEEEETRDKKDVGEGDETGDVGNNGGDGNDEDKMEIDD